MNEWMTEDTKVVLLLCGNFAGKHSEKPLALREYNALVQFLIAQGKRPADLLDATVLDEAAHHAALEAFRLEGLLARGVQLGFAVETWYRSGLWVISRSDADYPDRYKKHLKDKAPPLLFGAGNRSLLAGGGLAVVGSRNVDAEGADFASSVAALCARAAVPVVSGGARGVDELAMKACLEGGGVGVSVLADNLLKKSVERAARYALAEGRLLLLSPHHPTALFSVGSAMGRNKLIYALADFGLVVSAECQKGGTWAGAEEELQREVSIPLFVRLEGNVPRGNGALHNIGAMAWPSAIGQEDFCTTLRNAVAEKSPQAGNDPMEQAQSPRDGHDTVNTRIYDAVLPVLLDALHTPCTVAELAETLQVHKAQLVAWLDRALANEKVNKLEHPVRYAKKQHAQASLLDN